MPWLPIDTKAAAQNPPYARRGAVACTPKDAPNFYYDSSKNGGQRGGDPTYGKARAICRRCPLVAECLEWALDTRQRYGMWGGANPQERTAMLRDPALRAAVLRHARSLARPE